MLLHALGCTAYLSWFGTLAALSRTYRVVALDLRGHVRGIKVGPGGLLPGGSR